MSEAAVRGAGWSGAPPRPASAAPARAEPRRDASSAYELVVFACLGVFVAAQWARLMIDPPLGRLFLSLAAVCLGGWVLRRIAASGEGRRRDRLAAWGTAVGMLLGAIVLAGLAPRLLLPEHWGELFDRIGSGIQGIEEVHLPYRGADPDVRLAMSLAAPAAFAIAGAIAFWPAFRRERRRLIALAILVLTYAVAISLDRPGADLLLGVLLLALAASWLWITRLGGPQRAQALALTVAAGVIAVPVAARLDSGPLLDYESWDIFGTAADVSFEWDHTYGPLDWPADGATMLTVHSPTPLYWKTSVLDRFDGFAWQRAKSSDPLATVERQARYDTPKGVLRGRHPEWITSVRFQVDGLQSQFVTATGTAVATRGLSAPSRSADGTVTNLGGPLISGAEYSITSYVPRPTPAELRTAPSKYPEHRFGTATVIGLPNSLDPGYGIAMPLWGARDDAAVQRVLDSPYADTYRLASEWTAGATSPYDAVRAIEDHLRGDYTYDPNVLSHTYPLDSFLFDDRAGYCQQFAGAMGLMLRMVGIPSRVVAGFAPGTRHSDDGTFQVRDIDAHSWVEAYFRGIGWVTFDPTPAAAPAGSQSQHGELAGTRGPAPEPLTEESDPKGGATQGTAAGVEASSASGGGVPWAGVGLVLALAAGALVAALVVVNRRRRALAAGELADEQVSELRRALDRLGWKLERNVTLLTLERRFTAAGRAPLRSYLRTLREHRYAAEAVPPPGPAERRALRASISSGSLRRRLQGLLAIPPGGPSSRR
jgi:transglutaminase-like putative cysteine protease